MFIFSYKYICRGYYMIKVSIIKEVREAQHERKLNWSKWNPLMTWKLFSGNLKRDLAHGKRNEPTS